MTKHWIQEHRHWRDDVTGETSPTVGPQDWHSNGGEAVCPKCGETAPSLETITSRQFSRSVFCNTCGTLSTLDAH